MATTGGRCPRASPPPTDSLSLPTPAYSRRSAEIGCVTKDTDSASSSRRSFRIGWPCAQGKVSRIERSRWESIHRAATSPNALRGEIRERGQRNRAVAAERDDPVGPDSLDDVARRAGPIEDGRLGHDAVFDRERRVARGGDRGFGDLRVARGRQSREEACAEVVGGIATPLPIGHQRAEGPRRGAHRPFRLGLARPRGVHHADGTGSPPKPHNTRLPF